MSNPTSIKPFNLSKAALKPWIIWAFASLFYFYEMILRASPSVMTEELMQDFGVASTALGVLSSFYYYSYVALQIPCGIIVDRLGTRKVITFSTLLCVVGSLCFAYSQTLPLAQLGRFLIGAGSACAFISCLKISADWFLPAQFALIAGLTNMMGTLGGMFSGPPFAFLVNNYGWRQSTMIAAIAGLFLALLCWIVIKEKRNRKDLSLKNDSFWADLVAVASLRQNWIYAIFGGLMYVPISAFCELWAVPFLMKKYSVNNEVASVASVMVYLGIAIGSPIAAKLAGFLKSKTVVMSGSAFAATCMFLVALYIPALPLKGMVAILFLAGVLNGGQILSFAAVKEAMPDHMSGTAVGFTNAIVMMSGIIFQPLLGMLLDMAWDGAIDEDGSPFYSADCYHVSILAVPACLCLSWVILKLIRSPNQTAS